MTVNVSPIITDWNALHEVSTPVKIEEGSSLLTTTKDNITRLLETIPDDALGLAAPQIGIKERFFIASLTTGRFIFINPILHAKDKNPSKVRFEKVPSVEGCLSLPGVVRCVGRFHNVTIESDLVFEIRENDFFECERSFLSMKLKGKDAAIVQHEQDHLDGKLITDLPVVKSIAELLGERQEKKKKRKLQKQMKDSPKRTEQKMNPKRRQALQKTFKRAEKIYKKRVEIQERAKAREEGTIKSGKPE